MRVPVGWVRFGSLRRLGPISRNFGFDRGLPIDRYYVESFLARHASPPGYGMGDIRGHVLEVGDDTYTRRFGGVDGDDQSGRRESAVEKVDVFHVSDENPQATIVGDLASPEHAPSDSFDCIICTQTLHEIYDVRAAIRTLHRMLRPGGVLLTTFPGISQSCRPEKDLWGDYWRFTSLSARLLFEEVFPAANVQVEAYGNVLAAIAFLHGIAVEELTPDELDPRDPDYEVLIAVRAVKAAE
jgi:SAM-dependent methyltransferase